jgi:ankyrin repeat protein
VCAHDGVSNAQRGLSITAVDSTGDTLLIEAVSKGHIAAAEWLIQQGVAVGTVNGKSGSALHYATLTDTDDAATIELLLANGADVHKSSDSGLTALRIAATQSHVECVKALITAGADVNTADSQGLTGLLTAVIQENSSVTKLLLEHDASAVSNVIPIKCSVSISVCKSCSCIGSTALMVCTTVDIAKMLLAAGADVHVTK